MRAWRNRIGAALLVLGLAGRIGAADLQKGYTFTDGQRITASQLNALVDSGTILSGFYLGKSAETTLLSADTFLVWSPSLSAFRRITAGDALYNNTAIITSLAEKTTPATNDYTWIYDATGLGVKKVSLANLSLNNTNLIAGLPAVSSVALTSMVWVLNYGTNVQTTVSNLLALFNYTSAFTNLPALTTPTNDDRLLLYSSQYGSNRTTTLVGLVTNLPAAAGLAGTDLVSVVQTGIVKQATLNTLSNATVWPALTNYSGRFTSYDYTFASAGNVANTNHGLAGVPQVANWTLVCVTADTPYAVGQEIDVASVYDSNNENAFTTGKSATNVYCARSDDAGTTSLEWKNISTGAAFNPTVARWRARCRAIYFP